MSVSNKGFSVNYFCYDVGPIQKEGNRRNPSLLEFYICPNDLGHLNRSFLFPSLLTGFPWSVSVFTLAVPHSGLSQSWESCFLLSQPPLKLVVFLRHKKSLSGLLEKLSPFWQKETSSWEPLSPSCSGLSAGWQWPFWFCDPDMTSRGRKVDMPKVVEQKNKKK